MSLKFDSWALSFTAIALVLAVIYAGLTPDIIHNALLSMRVSPDAPTLALGDCLAAAVVILLGVLAVWIGANPLTVVSFGTVAAFVILTAHQSDLGRYLTLAAVFFCIGMYGMVVSRNAIRVLMSIELMLAAVNINLIAFARYIDPQYIQGQVFAVFILTVAAAEAAVGLGIVLSIYRNLATVDMERFNLLKW